MPVLEVPESETLEHIGDSEGHVWQVILYNDDYHLFDQVVAQVQKATGYAYHCPRADELERRIAFLEQIADSFGGEYDGWGVPVKR